MKIHKTTNYYRFRIREPRLFEADSFRTVKIGNKGSSKMIRGILKRTNNWATQAFLISREDYAKGLRVKKIDKRYVLVRGFEYE